MYTPKESPYGEVQKESTFCGTFCGRGYTYIYPPKCHKTYYPFGGMRNMPGMSTWTNTGLY
jgi:hypothetical protein